MLDSIIKLLCNYCKNEIKIFISVSPVPLAATFSGKDIISANNYSKSVLRCVAEAISTKYDNRRQYVVR